MLLLLISTQILLSVIALGGRKTVYAQLEHDDLKWPMLSLVFQGMNEEIYPWEVLAHKDSVTVGGLQVSSVEAAADLKPGPEKNAVIPQPSATLTPSPSIEPVPTAVPASEPAPEPNVPAAVEETEPGNGYIDENGMIQPFRKTTYDEYINHISADIYGTTGLERAGEYAFAAVDGNYFNDALFIGDSRTVGLRDYTDLSEYGDFLCETSLSIYKVFDRAIGKGGTVEDALTQKDYGKIYLSMGINELGRGTTEEYIGKYAEVIDRLRELEPDAIIFIQGIMKVTESKNEADPIFNNKNITARNRALATLADNQYVFFIDANEVVCDEEGNLKEEYTFDEIHLLGVYNVLIKEFLMEHGVKHEKNY